MSIKPRVSANIEDIRRLYMRADSHSRTRRRGGKDVRHIEAFLLQTALLEGVLVNYGLKLLEDRIDLNALRSKRGSWYGYDNAINDLYLLGAIDTKGFKDLEKFKAERNKYIHNLLSEDTEIVEGKVLRIYKEYKDLVWKMIEQLERKIKKTNKLSI